MPTPRNEAALTRRQVLALPGLTLLATKKVSRRRICAGRPCPANGRMDLLRYGRRRCLYLVLESWRWPGPDGQPASSVAYNVYVSKREAAHDYKTGCVAVKLPPALKALLEGSATPEVPHAGR